MIQRLFDCPPARRRLLLSALSLFCLSVLSPAPSLAATADADAAAHRCLALAMYWEAKAEGDAGMLAVGHVVVNRRNHPQFPDTLCGVVQQGGESPPCQFSWWCDGKSDRPREAANWESAQRLARELMTLAQQATRGSARQDPTAGALFFHSTGMQSPWRIPRTRTVTIGGHVFYKL